MKTTDVIVIGAGNGGLVAAALTAKAGYKTILFEKNNLPGGCATSFIRGRFEFEAALHELVHDSTASDLESVRNIFEEIGISVPLYYEDTLFRAIVKGENGYDFTLPAGYDEFLDAMDRFDPGCREKVKALIDYYSLIDDGQRYLNTGKINPATILTKYADFLRLGSHSINEVMDSLGISKKAQSLLGTYWGYLGVPCDDLNALQYLSLLTAFILKKPAMPYLRSHELSLALADAIRKYGGDVRYNSEVTTILFDEKGRACGVIANGEKIYAKKIISNVIPNNIFNRSDLSKIPVQAIKLANSRKLGMTFYTIYLGLNRSREQLGINDYSVFIANDPDSRKQYESRRNEKSIYVVNCLNKALPDSSPKDTCMLFFTILLMPGDFDENIKPSDYKKLKNRIARDYISDYEQTLGVSVMPYIEEISVATPATFARYLGTPDGCIYGYDNAGWDNIINRAVLADIENKIDNLSFCGGHGIRGDGYPSAYITGQMIGHKVIRELKEGK